MRFIGDSLLPLSITLDFVAFRFLFLGRDRLFDDDEEEEENDEDDDSNVTQLSYNKLFGVASKTIGGLIGRADS